MCVCVAVDGGSGTLKTIMDLIKKDTPAVLVEGMGRVTDLLAFAYKNSRPHPCQIIPDAGEPTFDILHSDLDLRRYGSAIVLPHGLLLIIDYEYSDSTWAATYEYSCLFSAQSSRLLLCCSVALSL